MRSSPGMLSFAVLVILGLAACEAEEPEVEPVPVAETAVEAPATAPAATAPAAGQAVLTVASSQEHGAYIADAERRALYLLEEDPQGESTCYDACAAVWPPYLAPQGSPTAGNPQVQANLIGTIQRRDGSTQVSYGGHPLYYYTRDQGPGQTTGHDVHDEWGEWYLVTPQGKQLEEH
jgi:predicted lipoprotein with Yx(FWY)xxD motif